MLTSKVCCYQDYTTDWYREWSDKFVARTMAAQATPLPAYTRKVWEWCAETQALSERGVLKPGSRGLGFAVGTEPLPAFFASLGCTVVGTDLSPSDPGSAAWSATAQHAAELENLYHPALIDRATFDERVSFRYADMREEWDFEPQSFDFIWSSCSFEHLGSLDAGLDFVRRSSRLLKPGGVAAHTTEFNVSSNDSTTTEGPTVIYRKRDIERLDGMLRRDGYCLAKPDFFLGDDTYDREYDYQPYFQNGRQHIKLLFDDYVMTSYLLIVLA